MKKVPLLLAALSGVSSFAAEAASSAHTMACDPRWYQSDMYRYGVGARDAKEVDWNILVRAEVLYWHPKTDYTELGDDPYLVGNDLYYDGMRTPYLSFDWDVGFKAGLGYVFANRGWECFAEYTRVIFNDSTSFNPGAAGRVLDSNFGPLIPADAEQNSQLTRQNYSHKISYQTGTLHLGKRFFLSPYVSLFPLFGVKAAWIKQSPNVTVFGTFQGTENSANTLLSEKTKGLGPLLACGTNWFMGKGFSLYANGGLAAIVFDYSGNVETPATSVVDAESNREHKRYMAANPMLNLGLSYYKEFGKQSVTAAIGFESQYYATQSYYILSAGLATDALPQGAFLSKDLMLYGINGSLSFAF